MMINPAVIVQTTMRDMNPSSYILPSPLVAAFSVLHQAHRTVRWIRRVQLYSQNCLKVAAGYGLNYAYGDSLLLKVSAATLMIATRILECIKQQLQLQKSWNKWVDALKGNYARPMKGVWNVKASSEFVSESTISWLNYQSERITERLNRIAIRTFKLVRDLVLLSVRIADAIDDTLNAFSSNSASVNEGINEFFVNTSQWTTKLVEDKELLLKGLKSNKQVIDKILTGISSFLTADQLIKAAEDALNQAASVASKVDKACGTVNDFIGACAAKWGHEFLESLGLEHIIPPDKKPSAKPFWEKAPRLIKRYPDVKKVTKAPPIRTPLPSPVKVTNPKPANSDSPHSPTKRTPRKAKSTPTSSPVKTPTKRVKGTPGKTPKASLSNSSQSITN